MATNKGDGVIDPVAYMVGQAGTGIANAGEEEATRRQGGVNPFQDILLPGMVDVMQGIKNGDDISLAKIHLAHIALTNFYQGMIGTKGAGGTFDVFLHQFKTAQAEWPGRWRPVAGPVALAMEIVRGQQPSEQAALTAAKVKKMRFSGEYPAFQQFAKDAVGGELAA